MFLKVFQIDPRLYFFIRNFILYLIFGLNSLFRIQDNKFPHILVYHSINDNYATPSRNAINVNIFEKQLNYLIKNFNIVSLDEIVNYIEGKIILPINSVAITFDDGFSDFYTFAYPYFKKYKLPVTMFVATNFCGNFYNNKNTMGWKELIEISKNNVEIGAHTMSHADLQKINFNKAKYEILGSKKEIEKRIGKVCNYFSYPFCKYNDRCVDLVRNLGFKAGLGCWNAKRIKINVNPFSLYRIEIDNSINFFLFTILLTSAVDLYKKICEIFIKK